MKEKKEKREREQKQQTEQKQQAEQTPREKILSNLTKLQALGNSTCSQAKYLRQKNRKMGFYISAYKRVHGLEKSEIFTHIQNNTDFEKNLAEKKYAKEN